jgi:hypothetical protein
MNLQRVLTGEPMIAAAAPVRHRKLSSRVSTRVAKVVRNHHSRRIG